MTTHQDQENPLMDNNIKSNILPELLKIILTKAVWKQMYSEDNAKRQRDESIFRRLASVDFLWWSSMRKYNLRNKIRHLSKVYFQRVKVRSTIIRNNRNFLKEVIDPDKIIFPLKSCGCLTEDQVTFLTQLRNRKDKNHELLLMLQDSTSQKYSKFVDCLFATNQSSATLVLERGGEAVKVSTNNGKAAWTKEFKMELIKSLQRMQTENTLILNDLLNNVAKERLNHVCILHAKQNKGIELWFWCKTESSLNQMKSLSEEDIQEIIQRLIPEHSSLLQPQLIQMDHCLANDFAERRLSIRHVGDIDNSTVPEYSPNIGFPKHVTTLADEIYVAQETKLSVYWNKHPYKFLKSIVIGQGFRGLPFQIASCNINKCLYISFSAQYPILKVEPMLEHRVSEWLRETGIYIISVTCRGDVLVLGIGSRDNELRIITHERAVKRTIPMEYRFGATQCIQEIMPDIVALNYGKLSPPARSCIAIMRLDENGTVGLLRIIEWHETIGGVSSFRCGDLFIAVFEHQNAHVLPLRSDNLCVKLQHWTLESKEPRDLLTTDAKIVSIHFDADQKQLYVLSRCKLDVYHLYYEDEVYN